MIKKVQLLWGSDRGLVLLGDVADAARELQARGVVFQDRQADTWLVNMSRRGVIEPTKWVADADRGVVAWHWDEEVRHGLQHLIAALDSAA